MSESLVLDNVCYLRGSFTNYVRDIRGKEERGLKQYDILYNFLNSVKNLKQKGRGS